MDNESYPLTVAVEGPDKMSDTRDVVEAQAFECRQCPWAFGPRDIPSGPEDRRKVLEELYDAQHAHCNESGHRYFWVYAIQRGTARVVGR